MGYRRCNVGAVLNVQADHLGLRGIDTLEDLARVKRIVVEVAQDTAVLNADDPLCLEMADYTRAQTICYVTMNPDHSLVRDHIQAEGRAVVLEHGMGGSMITIYDKSAHIPLLWTHLIPASLEGKALHNVQNAMFAAGIAYSMGVRTEDIQHGLRTFNTTYFQAPGRMNIFDELPFKVILDYGHNPAAVRTMVQLTDRLECKGKRVLVVAAPGDRRDEDIREIGRICAGHFDRYICRRDDTLRGRGPDEVPRMLREALLEAGVSEDAVEVIPDEQEAVDRALRLGEPHDLLLVFGDAISRSWKQISKFSPDAAYTRDEPAGAPASVPSPDVAQPEWDEGRKVIRDERGVRLAREAED
jgi:cyanophycin synthetase